MRTQWESRVAAEDEHFAPDGTRDRVDVVVDGAPTVGHDPVREYVQFQMGGAECGS
jgi:hypothetical protein